MGDTQRSYMYEYNAPSGDKYSFIGVDASLDPGPRRPFNFFGWIKDVNIFKMCVTKEFLNVFCLGPFEAVGRFQRGIKEIECYCVVRSFSDINCDHRFEAS